MTSWRSGSPEPAQLYDRSYLTEKDKYSSFLGGNQPLCVIRNENARDGGKLLLIRDSYSDALAPFLAQSFAEVHLLDLRYYRLPAAQYAAENGIDAICAVYSVPQLHHGPEPGVPGPVTAQRRPGNTGAALYVLLSAFDQVRHMLHRGPVGGEFYLSSCCIFNSGTWLTGEGSASAVSILISADCRFVSSAKGEMSVR